MKIFQYVVFIVPEEKEDGTKEKPAILVQPTTVIAADEKKAGIMATWAIPEEFRDRLDEVNIVVRPF